jgi:hypothetical protein
MNRGFLKFAAALIGTLMIVVPFAGLDGLPRELRSQVKAEKSALDTAQSNLRAAKADVSSQLENEHDLFRGIPASAQWPGQLNDASRDLDTAAVDMSQLTALEKQNRRGDRQRVEDLLSHERGLRSVAATRAESIRKDAAHWVALKQRLPEELEQMDRDYRAIQAFDFAAAAAAMQKAGNDWPEKRSDLESRLSSLRASVGQADTLWQSSAEARQQAAAKQFTNLDYGTLLNAAETLHTTTAALPQKTRELQALTGQLYTSWDKVLVDMRKRGGEYDQQIRTITAPQGGTTASNDQWITVPRGIYEAGQNNLGMAIEHKALGKYDSEAERTAQPAGFAYMAPPGQRNQYGYWENRSGHDFWVFYGQYALLRDLLFNRDYRPLDRGDWEGYRSSRQRGQTYYGDSDRGARYGTQGSTTQDRYSGSTFSKSGGFKDSKYASKPGGYRDSQYASPSSRKPESERAPRSFGSGSNRPSSPPRSFSPPPRSSPRPSSAPRRFGKH